MDKKGADIGRRDVQQSVDFCITNAHFFSSSAGCFLTIPALLPADASPALRPGPCVTTNHAHRGT